MKSASSSRTTPAASTDAAGGAASAPQGTPAAAAPPRRRPRWRLITGALLTFGLCLGAALLIKREHQRQAALSLLEDCGCKAMAWHSPWSRVPSSETFDWDELRSRPFLYPDVIITPEFYFGQAERRANQVYTVVPGEDEPADDSEESEDNEDNEDKQMLKDLHKSDPLKLLAALQVLRPKMLLMRWSQPQAPALWRGLAQVTSLEGLMVTAWWGGFDDRALREITRLPHLSVLVVTTVPSSAFSGITDAGLACLESCPQLKTLSLKGTRVTPAGAQACLRRCPHLQIKLNGEGVSAR